MSRNSERVEGLLTAYERFDASLGDLLRNSQHIGMWRAGQASLAAWETSGLGAGYRHAEGPTYRAIVRHLAFSETLTELPARNSRHDRWGMEDVERLDSLALKGSKISLRYQKGRQQFVLQVTAPALAPEPAEALAEALAVAEGLERLARGRAPHWLNDNAFGLIPAWGECKVQTDARARDIVETGARFLCRALASYPAYLLILRGVKADTLLARFLSGAVETYRRDVDQARAGLPGTAEAFWAAPQLPAVPPPHLVPSEGGPGEHLPPVRFWPKPEDNRMFTEAVQRLYKNVPRKLVRMSTPRRSW